MRMKSLHCLGLIVLAAATLHGQSQPATNGAVFWSTVPPDCSSLSGESPATITNSSGATVGYSCWVSGTFVWLAAGGAWSSTIRVAAPTSGTIGVDYTFYDTTGNRLKLDTTLGSGSATESGSEVDFAASANQPAEVNILGATSNAPSYNTTETGSVYAVFYCPDATTCGNVLPQLLYSALPSIPWSLSVPIAWDDATWTTWSAEGIDDGGAHRVSLVIYNEGTSNSCGVATSFTVQVYDSTGKLAGTGTTPSIPPLATLSSTSCGEAGTYGALLSDVIKTPLPSGIFKILVDGGAEYSAVEVLQFTGASATSLQVGYDSAPGSSSTAGAVRGAITRNSRVRSTPKPVFSALSE